MNKRTQTASPAIGGYVTSAVPQQAMSQIDRSLELIGETVSRIGDKLSTLASRLSPVLANRGSGESTGDKMAEPDAFVVLAQRIRNINGNAVECELLIDSILERLEL